MITFVISLINDEWIKTLITLIALDTILGVLRSIKEKETNSCIGIDGIIRKVAMLFCIFFLSLVDHMIQIDFISFIPEELKTMLNLQKIGIADLFNLLFIIFEFLSIIKNAIRCKLPIPKKLQEFLEKIMKQFTGELNNKNETIIQTNEVKIERVYPEVEENEEGE